MSYPPFAVTVDLVLMTVVDNQLAVLLQRREVGPFAGLFALPGGFVGIDERLGETASRILADKAGFAAGDSTWLEQLYTFGDPARDPRMRTVSVAYFALLPHARLANAVSTRTDLVITSLQTMVEPMAFDHPMIIKAARERLQGKLDYTPIAFALLPDLFTLRDLQRTHEAITGTSFNKPAFRRRMLDTGWVEPTGLHETNTAFRPAELYRQRG